MGQELEVSSRLYEDVMLLGYEAEFNAPRANKAIAEVIVDEYPNGRIRQTRRFTVERPDDRLIVDMIDGFGRSQG